MYRNKEIDVLLKTNGADQYNFYNILDPQRIEFFGNLQTKAKEIMLRQSNGFFGNLSIKKVNLELSQALLLLQELCKSDVFYGMLVDINGEPALKRYLKIPAYYNVYNMAEVVIRLKSILSSKPDNIEQILKEKLSFYIYLYKSTPEIVSLSDVDKEMVLANIELYFSPKVSVAEQDKNYPKKVEIISGVMRNVFFKDKLFYLLDVLNDNSDYNLLFSINTSIIANKISYPYYSSVVILYSQGDSRPIYQNCFMGMPNVRFNDGSICLGELSKDILSNYAALEIGNLSSPLTNEILSIKYVGAYVELVKGVLSEYTKELNQLLINKTNQ